MSVSNRQIARRFQVGEAMVRRYRKEMGNDEVMAARVRRSRSVLTQGRQR